MISLHCVLYNHSLCAPFPFASRVTFPKTHINNNIILNLSPDWRQWWMDDIVIVDDIDANRLHQCIRGKHMINVIAWPPWCIIQVWFYACVQPMRYVVTKNAVSHWLGTNLESTVYSIYPRGNCAAPAHKRTEIPPSTKLPDPRKHWTRRYINSVVPRFTIQWALAKHFEAAHCLVARILSKCRPPAHKWSCGDSRAK